MTILHLAAGNGLTGIVKKLMTKPDVDVNALVGLKFVVLSKHT